MRGNRFTLLVENQKPRAGSSLVDRTNEDFLCASHVEYLNQEKARSRERVQRTAKSGVGAKMECPGETLERGNAQLLKIAGMLVVESMWQFRSLSVDTVSYDLPLILSSLSELAIVGTCLHGSTTREWSFLPMSLGLHSKITEGRMRCQCSV